MTTHITATLTEQGLSLIVNGDPKVVPMTHINFEEILACLRDGDHDSIPALLDVARGIEIKCDGLVSITNGVVKYNGEVMQGTLVERMLDMVNLGLDVKPLSRFLINLMKNPSRHSVTQLYDFMEACDLPITEDGRLLCYKSVRDNYMDQHTGKIDNSIGQVVEMARNKVDDNPDQTCSHGLHVCSQNYGMYGVRLVLVAVCPSDVVSVPRDYNSAKMRVCKYEVMKDVQEDGFRNFDKEPIYQDSEIDWDIDDDEDEDEDYFDFR